MVLQKQQLLHEHKMKKIFILLISLFLLSFVYAGLILESWSADVDAGNNNLNNVNNITANNFIGNITGEITGAMDWTHLQNYPSACPGSSAITTLGDSVTCSDLWVDVTGDDVTDLRIIDDSDLGSEIATQANAVSDPNGNEADAFTGWTVSGGVLASQTNNPYVGTYQLMSESADSNDHMEYDFTVEVGKTYKISFAARRGNQGTTQEVSWGGFSTDPIIDIPSESWAEHEVILLADSTNAKIKVHSAKGGATGDKVHFDNLSIREVTGGDLAVIGNAVINLNLNVSGNIYVQGCIIYNMSGTPATLGDCI